MATAQEFSKPVSRSRALAGYELRYVRIGQRNAQRETEYVLRELVEQGKYIEVLAGTVDEALKDFDDALTLIKALKEVINDNRKPMSCWCYQVKGQHDSGCQRVQDVYERARAFIERHKPLKKG